MPPRVNSWVVFVSSAWARREMGQESGEALEGDTLGEAQIDDEGAQVWLSLATGASVRAVAPFPVAARQTGQADFPHPAFTHSIKPSLLAGRRGAQGYEKARAFASQIPWPACRTSRLSIFPR